MSPRSFEIVSCSQGETLRDPENGQAMHSSIGPTEEARLIFIEPSRLAELLAEATDRPLVLWDVGMGIAANSVLAWHLAHSPTAKRPLVIESFEKHPEALAQVLMQAFGSAPSTFEFLTPHRDDLRALLSQHQVESRDAANRLHRWNLHAGDFATQMETGGELSEPDLIFWDFYSPAVCPSLWSLELFATVRSRAPRALLFTYSAATPVRVALLLAGFHVGRSQSEGSATPIKSESTMAVASSEDRSALISPLGEDWLKKLERSSRFRPYGQTRWSTEAGIEEILAAVRPRIIR